MSRKHPDVQAELNALRAQVEALTKAQADAAAASADEAASDGAGAEMEPPSEPTASAMSLDFEELVDLLKHEIEDTKPLTALAIFGLGVLTGRLLSH